MHVTAFQIPTPATWPLLVAFKLPNTIYMTSITDAFGCLFLIIEHGELNSQLFEFGASVPCPRVTMDILYIYHYFSTRSK